MTATIVGLSGELAGKQFTVGSEPITFGRGSENDVVLTTPSASRIHAELRLEADRYMLYDRGSTNGTWVNSALVTVHELNSGDRITIGDEVFRFETIEAPTATRVRVPADRKAATRGPEPVLRVTITGGGPVGLSFALLLEHLMGPRVAIKIHDGRWTSDGGSIVWKGPDQGNVRRQQVVTIQSRQFLKLPPEVQERLFSPVLPNLVWNALRHIQHLVKTPRRQKEGICPQRYLPQEGAAS